MDTHKPWSEIRAAHRLVSRPVWHVSLASRLPGAHGHGWLVLHATVRRDRHAYEGGALARVRVARILLAAGQQLGDLLPRLRVVLLHAARISVRVVRAVSQRVHAAPARSPACQPHAQSLRMVPHEACAHPMGMRLYAVSPLRTRALALAPSSCNSHTSALSPLVSQTCTRRPI